MKRFMIFLITGLLLAILNVNAKISEVSNTNGKSCKVNPAKTPYTTKVPDFINYKDTSAPQNSDKNKNSQDYNSTRSNKANCVIIINVGDGSDDNDSTPKKLYAQDFNTTLSNSERGQFVININNNSSNSSDTTPIKLYAQDFNSTRSNRQNSAIVINVTDYTPNSNDSTPSRQEAQDYNSSRSNKANSVITINVDNGTTNSNDSIPSKQEAQDYNSSRSNKANSVITINVDNGTTNSNDSIPSKQEAQDYNSSRSNKNYSRVKNPLYNGNGNSGENPMYEGMTKNGIREKQYRVADNVTLVIREMSPDKNAEQEKKNPLYDGNNTTHDNPLYNGNAINGNSGNDSTSNPGKHPSRQEAQDYNSSRSNKCNSFSIDAGFVNGSNDHAGNGWDVEMENQFSISKRLKLAVSAGYASLQFKYKGSPLLSEEYVQNMKRSIMDHKWSLMTLSVGPVVSLGSRKFKTDLYGKAGVTFIQSPDQFIGIPDDKGIVTNETGVAKFSGSTTAFSFQTGININYAISKKVDIFLNPNFFSAVGKKITYKEKDAAKALIDGNNFDYKTFMSLPYETKQEHIRLLGVSAGFSIHFCK